MRAADEPAFPVTKHDSCGNPIRENYGLTKRKYFAAMAMQGFISNGWCSDSEFPHEVVGQSVKCADELLDALRSSKEGV